MVEGEKMADHNTYSYAKRFHSEPVDSRLA